MSSARISSLDALRGIAALAVVLYHYTFRYNALYGHNFSLEPLSVLKYGHLGVQLFFIISGFVIYLSIENTQSIKKFASNRFARLYPAYWCAVFVTFFTVMIFGLPGRDVSFSNMLVNLSMLQGFLNVTNVDGVYWTLKIELSFYLIIATLYFFIPKKYFLINFLILVSAGFFVKYLYLSGDVSFIVKIINLVFSLEYLHFFGAGIGFYLFSKRIKFLQATLLIAMSISYNLVFGTGIELLVTLTFYPVFLLLILGKIEFINNPALTYLGSISYSLYLVHQNIGYIIFNYLYKYDFHPLFSFFAVFTTVILIAHFISKYIEQILGKKLKNKLSDYVK